MAEQQRNEHGLLPYTGKSQHQLINEFRSAGRKAGHDVWQVGSLWVRGTWRDDGRHRVAEVCDIRPDGIGGWVAQSGPAGWYQPGR